MSEQDNRATIQDLVAGFNAHDLDQFLRPFAPGFRMHVILKPEQLLPPGQLTNPAAYAAYLLMLFAAFPDLLVETFSLEASAQMVYHQIIVHGTHRGPLTLPNGRTLQPTGFFIDLPMEIFHSFDAAGHYVASTSYVNLLDVMHQFRL